MKEVERIRAEPISVDELSLATSYLEGVFPIRFETTSAIAAALSVLAIHRLPQDYYDRYRDRVRAITREQILDAARRHLHPDALQMVVVGDPAIVRAPLEGMRFGPLTLYDTLGQPTAMTATEERDQSGIEPGKVRSQRVYTGRIINLDRDTVRFPDGSIGELEMIRHPGASAIVPFLSDPAGDDPQILLIKQYRYAADQFLYEIPAGRLDAGEEPLACAIRELREETGCTARRMEFLFTMFTTPGFTDEKIHVFIAVGLEQGVIGARSRRIHDRRDHAAIARAGPHPQWRDQGREDSARDPVRGRISRESLGRAGRADQHGTPHPWATPVSRTVSN